MILFWFSGACAAAVTTWLENGSTKVRQDAVTNSQTSITIKAAKNEFEPFQLVIKNDATPRTLIDVTVTDFTGTGGTIAAADHVLLFKEEYVYINFKSIGDGEYGYWPDALLPKKDSYFHMNRSTFPFSMAANWVQPVWVDVFVPSGTVAGTYTATISATENSVEFFSGTITLIVWNFTLPATPSYRTMFSLTITGAGFGGSGTFVENGTYVNPMRRLHMAALLKHRMGTNAASISRGTWNGTTWVGWSATNHIASIEGFIDGTQTGQYHVEYGATELPFILNGDTTKVYSDLVWSNFATYCNGTYGDEPPQAYLDAMTSYMTLVKANLSDEEINKTFWLPIDEPGGGGDAGKCGDANPALDYESAKAAADIIHSFSDGTHTFRTRITSSRKAELLDGSGNNPYWDLWLPPYVNVIGRKWDYTDIDTTADYASDIAAGKELGWYHSCMVGGCGTLEGGSVYYGYSNYYVDFPANRVRIFPWASFKYNVTAEMYWGTTYQYGPSGFGTAYALTYIADNQFSLSGDLRTTFMKGAAVTYNNSVYGYIRSWVASTPTYSGGVTTVTLIHGILESGGSTSIRRTLLMVGDPYYSMWDRGYAKNPDGNFFYPGVVSVSTNGLPDAAKYGDGYHTPSIGGTDSCPTTCYDIPVESIRLKLFREGEEDYEYLWILEGMALEADAKAVIQTNLASGGVFNTYNFTADEENIYTAREALATLILGGAPPGPTPKGIGKSRLKRYR